LWIINIFFVVVRFNECHMIYVSKEFIVKSSSILL
jgi:hypothetical protein